MIDPSSPNTHDSKQGLTGYIADYLQRWRYLSIPALLYLLHAAFLTGSLAISALFFNLAIDAMGYPRTFLGQLDSLAILVAASLSLPLWWLVTRIGLRQAMIANAIIQATSVFIYAFWPAVVPLLFAVSLTGMGGVLFQVSAAPFMMRYSDSESRDHLFSASASINIGVAGLGSFLAGPLPGIFARWLDVEAQSALAYRATFVVAGFGLLLALIPLLLIKEEHLNQSASATTNTASRQWTGIIEQARGLWHALVGRLRSLRSSPLIETIPEPYRGVVRRPWPVIQLLISPFLISCGAALTIRYLNLFFRERFGVGDELLGIIFATLSIATGIAALIGPIVSIRIGKIQTIALIQALSIPFLLTMAFTPVLAIVFGAALIRASLFNMASPLYDAFAMERTDEALRPIVIGLVNGAYTAGYLIAPLVSTWVQEHYGFTPLFVATAIFYSSAMLANYWLFIHPKQPFLREKQTSNT
ncbi:MAG: MFS transporter [Chloroflexota bacterium]